MSKADIWMPLYVGDYLADTMEFDAPEHGAYLLLILHYWRTRQPLPLDEKTLLKIAKIPTSRVNRCTLKRVIGKFTFTDNGYRHNRIDLELEKAQQRKEKGQQNGKLGGNPAFKKGQPNPYYKDNLGDNPKDKQKIKSSPSPSPSTISTNVDIDRATRSKPPKVYFINQEKVKLTQEQYDSLRTEFAEDEIAAFISRCENYCLSTGKSYKDYAATMRNWEKKPQKTNGNQQITFMPSAGERRMMREASLDRDLANGRSVLDEFKQEPIEVKSQPLILEVIK